MAENISEDHLSATPTFHKSSNTVDITSMKSINKTRQTKNSNKDYAAIMLESAEGPVSPRRMINVAYYFSDADSIYKWQKHRTESLYKEPYWLNPICKIKCIGNQLVCIPCNKLRIHFKNANGLPTSKSGCNSDKVSILRHVWSKLNVDFMSLVETQISPLLLPNKDSLHTSMFQIMQMHP